MIPVRRFLIQSHALSPREVGRGRRERGGIKTPLDF